MLCHRIRTRCRVGVEVPADSDVAVAPMAVMGRPVLPERESTGPLCHRCRAGPHRADAARREAGPGAAVRGPPALRSSHPSPSSSQVGRPLAAAGTARRCLATPEAKVLELSSAGGEGRGGP
jgi:hypothetical protein